VRHGRPAPGRGAAVGEAFDRLRGDGRSGFGAVVTGRRRRLTSVATPAEGQGAVERRKVLRTGGLTALVVGASLLLSGCTAKDWERNLRFGWPTGVTKQAERMRVLWTWSCVAALAVGVLVWGLIFWACIRYRKRGPELPRQRRENLAIEAVYTTLPFVIIGLLFWRTVVVENYVEKRSAHPDTTIQVTAFKWNWQFTYLDEEALFPGKSGSDPANHANTVGTSTEIPILVVPRGETVRIVEHSRDVIHSFWVPEFLFKRDVIPMPAGHDNQFEFTATENGHYVGRCAELCGTYHSQMNFEVRVVDPAKYDDYLKALAAIGPDDPNRQAKALTAIGESPFATTTHPFDTSRTSRQAS
jgi:cytochrome c oxidase subunit 2